jgi:methylthioribose-1-phosphate isomerase
MNSSKVFQYDNVKLSDDCKHVIIIDQTKLPTKTEYLYLSKTQECFDAIKSLAVRGAPAIGIFAAYAAYVIMNNSTASDYSSFRNEFMRNKEYLISSRPTAVNLSWALNRMEKVVLENSTKPISIILDKMKSESISIHHEDISMCLKIAENGITLMTEGCGILTHCNAGPLATSKYGTALGPLLLAKERGMNFKVFSDETRPLLQGARLTSLELSKAGIDVTLICDNMASIVMKNGWINACFVGCDRVAANGDFANKIGTSGVAVLAKYYGIPFYTLGPTSTIDMNCKSGKDIIIEQRDPEEIKTKFYVTPQAPDEVKCYNPAFDVTDHTLVTGIVTEKGICYPPFEKSLKSLFSESK